MQAFASQKKKNSTFKTECIIVIPPINCAAGRAWRKAQSKRARRTSSKRGRRTALQARKAHAAAAPSGRGSGSSSSSVRTGRRSEEGVQRPRRSRSVQLQGQAGPPSGPAKRSVAAAAARDGLSVDWHMAFTMNAESCVRAGAVESGLEEEGLCGTEEEPSSRSTHTLSRARARVAFLVLCLPPSLSRSLCTHTQHTCLEEEDIQISLLRSPSGIGRQRCLLS